MSGMTAPARYREQCVRDYVEATQWWRNGDHPDDGVGEPAADPAGGTYARIEGAVVGFFRRPEPEYAGDTVHQQCGRRWRDHGWIDEGGHTVCPGDWVVTGLQGWNSPCKPDIFEATYEKRATYLTIDRDRRVSRTLDLDGEVMVDVDGDGCVAGVERIGGRVDLDTLALVLRSARIAAEPVDDHG